MARRLFEFECPKGHLFDDLWDTNTPENVECPKCSLVSKRLISATRIDPKLGVNASAFPTMGDRWERIRRQRTEIDNKKVRDHGPDA